MIIYITTKTPTDSDCVFIKHAALHAKAHIVLAEEAVYRYKKYAELLQKPLFGLADDLTLRGIPSEDDLVPLTIDELVGLSELSKSWIVIDD